MSLKLQKYAEEREKARQKRDLWDERMKEWDKKFNEQENSEICELVHAQNLTPEQLANLIKLSQTTVPNPEKLIFKEEK